MELLVGDIRDLSFLTKTFKECDAIAHLAALPGLVKCNENPEDATTINIFGTYNVLESVRRLDIEKIVFCSSAAVYGKPKKLPITEDHHLNPLNLYGVTKMIGENLMDIYNYNYDINTISLRFGNVFGVGLYTNFDTVIPKFVRMGLQGDYLTVYGDGTSSRDFVHVEDITNAITLALKSKSSTGEVYNVGGETMFIGQLAKLVVELIKDDAGRTIGLRNLPTRPGETKEFSYDIKKIENDFGYVPTWNIEQGIRQIISYQLEEKN